MVRSRVLANYAILHRSIRRTPNLFEQGEQILFFCRLGQFSTSRRLRLRETLDRSDVKNGEEPKSKKPQRSSGDRSLHAGQLRLLNPIDTYSGLQGAPDLFY